MLKTMVRGSLLALLLSSSVHAGVITSNAATDFVAGPTAQSSTNQWQYLHGNAARSSFSLLSDWDAGGNEVLPGMSQWDNNGGPGANDHYPFVQKTSAGGPHGLFGSDISGDALILHPGWQGNGADSVVAVAWYNNTGETVSFDFDVTFTLEEGHNSNGIQYFVQRSVTTDIGRFLSIQNGSIGGGVEDALFNSTGAGIELLAGESIYFGVDNNGSYEWDHTRLDLDVTATFDDPVTTPIPGTLLMLIPALALLRRSR